MSDIIEIDLNLPNSKLYSLRYFKSGCNKPYKEEFYIKYTKTLKRVINYNDDNTQVQAEYNEIGYIESIRTNRSRSFYEIMVEMYRRLFG